MLHHFSNALALALMLATWTAGDAQAQWDRHLSSFGAELNLSSMLPLAPSRPILASVVSPGAYRLNPEQEPGPRESEDKQQRKARLFISIGSGMLVSAPLHMGLMSAAACQDRTPTLSYVVGALMGSVGFGLTYAGAKRLAPHGQRRPASPARKFGLVMLTLATLTVSELLMFMASQSDLICSDG